MKTVRTEVFKKCNKLIKSFADKHFEICITYEYNGLKEINNIYFSIEPVSPPNDLHITHSAWMVGYDRRQKIYTSLEFTNIFDDKFKTRNDALNQLLKLCEIYLRRQTYKWVI
jgi:hypothetical protein